jgi:PTS system fructose-specific IIC component
VKIGDLVRADDIVLGIRAKDVADAAQQILALTLPKHGVSSSEARRLIDAVIAREREMPTNCGVSAVPHARDASLRSFIVAVGVNRDGILENAKEPRVIVTFLSPESLRNDHLALLASLSRLSHDRATIDAIADAKTAEEVVALLQR